MSNRTYVCLGCRTSKRAKAAYGLATDYRCSLCSKPLSELDWKRRVPAKTDVKGWKELQTLVFKTEQEWTPRRTRLGIARIHKINGTISGLKKRPDAEKQEQRIKRLQFQRRVTKKTHNLD